ncbi:tRNA-methyltransferase subunit [Pelomyxa schiedti]|nr:tRNA-methyltransferase subunit [Pelomyxa schiedti]
MAASGVDDAMVGDAVASGASGSGSSEGAAATVAAATTAATTSTTSTTSSSSSTTAPAAAATTTTTGGLGLLPEAQGDRVRPGDVLIALVRKGEYAAVHVRHGGLFNCASGSYLHDKLIDQEYGSTVPSSKNEGSITLLKFSPVLWTKALTHRTQILYGPDISLIIQVLGIRPGSLVIESGTGSGSLSTSLATTVAPHGHLYTYDFHPNRSSQAKEEFVRNGIINITATERDVCQYGFDLDSIDLKGKIDAVFLDLPTPTKAIPHACKMLRPFGSICTFSPCIEQVQGSHQTLVENGFVEIQTVEFLDRPYNIFPYRSTVLDTTPAAPTPTEPSATSTGTTATNSNNSTTPAKPGTKRSRANDKSAVASSSRIVCAPVSDISGHTGYLTFAHKSPSPLTTPPPSSASSS